MLSKLYYMLPQTHGNVRVSYLANGSILGFSCVSEGSLEIALA
jgi:hypothetical protein